NPSRYGAHGPMPCRFRQSGGRVDDRNPPIFMIHDIGIGPAVPANIQEKRTPRGASSRVQTVPSVYLTLLRRRRRNPSPARAVPNRTSEAGSGTRLPPPRPDSGAISSRKLARNGAAVKLPAAPIKPV